MKYKIHFFKNASMTDLNLRIIKIYFYFLTAKGRTNTELREQFTLAKGVSQSMAGFTSKSPSGSSYSGSSTYSGATSPWSARSPSNASGPVIKVKQKSYCW